MKTILDAATRQEVVKRIESLDPNSTARWGKMNVYQMLKHATLSEEMFLGKRKYKRALIGRIFGRMGLRNLLKDDRPLQRNAPTSGHFKITETGGDVAEQKRKWIALVQEYSHYGNKELVHWFFGTMTPDQVGYFAYKHADHHLRQFGA